ncbi:asparaginase domain-containing protein [Aequoribacter sp.]|jgi:L-asparaginase|uniref:asparaginase domain-containing protein n=1 Tax=Aequoribacter sp. TaxID=2847771 RepID=UPI003C3BEE01
MHIHIITTGGTIDKVYFDAKSTYQIGQPVIERLLDEMNVAFSHTLIPLMRIDSLDMSDKHRQTLADCIAELPAGARVIVTHGTDTMTDSARYLGNLVDKTVVFTGALQPAAFRDSDAIFNIGCALGAAQSAAPGAYIAMNGQIFEPGQVIKNRDANRFEAIT